MMLKRFFGFLAGVLVASSLARAASVALIYVDEQAIRSGKPLVGAVVSDGIVAPADAVLASGGDVFVGLSNDDVRKASLVRLDKDVNVAVLRLGERLLNPELQAIHRKRAASLQALLPTEIVTDTTTAATAQMDLGQPLLSSGTPVFKITFNGAPVTKDVVHFNAWLNKQRFSVELAAINTEPIQNFTLTIHANPTLTFANLQSSLTRVPVPGYDFKYEYPSAVKPGKTFKFPIEARGIGSKDYEWIIEVKSAGHLQQEKVFVHFD